MATQTNHGESGFLSNAEAIGWIGSGITSSLWGPKSTKRIFNSSTKYNSKYLGKFFSGRELLKSPNDFYNIAFDRFGDDTNFISGTRKAGFRKGKPAFVGSRGVVQKQANLYARRQMRSALRIAGNKGTGIATTAGWKAASRRGLTGSFAKIALGKVGSVALPLFTKAFSAQLVYGAAKSSFLMLRNEGRSAKKMEMGKPFMDSNAAYTERQRSVRAITSSRMSTRSAIGGEAAMMHR